MSDGFARTYESCSGASHHVVLNEKAVYFVEQRSAKRLALPLKDIKSVSFYKRPGLHEGAVSIATRTAPFNHEITSVRDCDTFVRDLHARLPRHVRVNEQQVYEEYPYLALGLLMLAPFVIALLFMQALGQM